MLHEFALSPDIFFPSAFGVRNENGEFIPAENHGHLALSMLWKGVIQFGVVRNLADGEWGNFLDLRQHELHVRSRETLKKLKIEGRIVDSAAQNGNSHSDEQSWLNEALASHIANPRITQFFGTDEFCSSINAADFQQLPKGVSKIPFCTPFSGRGCSIKVSRSIASYVSTLMPLFKYSRSLMFIDPYLNLEAHNYQGFVQLLKAVAATNPIAEIELHRQITPSKGEVMKTSRDWHDSFDRVLSSDPALASLRVNVFIWDEFHDRYLISNLMGISVPYGFDTSTKEDETRWTMLSAEDTDDVRNEFTDGDPMFRRTLIRP
jgi:hypothetical protein